MVCVSFKHGIFNVMYIYLYVLLIFYQVGVVDYTFQINIMHGLSKKNPPKL